MSKQKVLYVFGGEKASGAEIVIERLINHNLDSVEAHLFIAPGEFSYNLINSGRSYPITVVNRLKKLNRSSTNKINFYFKALENYFIIPLRVIKYIKKNNINCVHANTIVPASYLIPAILYCRLFASKKKWFWSDHDLKYFARQDHIFSSLCANIYNSTFVVSNAVKSKYRSVKKVAVLYNGLDTQLFKPDHTLRQDFRTSNNFSNSDIVCGIAATISPRKGQLVLIEALKEIQIEFPNLYLIIAGHLSDDTPSYNQHFIKAIANNPQIRYVGHFFDMVTFYNGCDIVINNSSIEGSEPLGTTIYEAMACQKVVIASKTGGTPEIIQDGIDGFIFEPESKEALKTVLRNIIEGKKNLEIIKQNARESVKQKFSLDVMARNYNELIK